MRSLLPEPGPVDPAEAHARAPRPPPAGRPWVAVNMVASVDGAIAVDGLSGGLSGPADKEVFAALRGIADVILVAAGSARVERYRAPRTPPARRAERVARGQAPFPRLAVLTRSLDLDPAGPLFTGLPEGPEQPERPLLYTVAGASGPRRRDLEPVAEVVECGLGSVPLASLLRDLDRRGCTMVLAEGGPSLVGQLIGADLVDEVDLTTSPHLVGGTGPRVAGGGGATQALVRLAHLWEADDFLFSRYVRA